MQIKPASEIKAVSSVANNLETQHKQLPSERNGTKVHQQIRQPGIGEIENGTKQLQAIVSTFNKRLKFDVHEETNRIFVQVIDSATGEVIWEVPPVQILDMLAKIYEVVGLLVDERV
jgi:flagellar protein FlaG